MGIVNMGIPRAVVSALAKAQGVETFVETGTFHGGTARWASEQFDVVHTIELSRPLYEKESPGLNAIRGVRAHFGDSRKVLPDVLRELGPRRALFWLDGHWSGGDTYGEQDECPVLEELRLLVARNDDIILIDDARCFLATPASPHDPAQWPTLTEIFRVLGGFGIPRFVQVIDDVIFIVPKGSPAEGVLVRHAQERANEDWRKYQRTQGPGAIGRKLRRMISG